ncbi:MAG: hypothetical protein HN712_03560 [Gemmatimonadetes bacterium]|jgi:uncharacterized Zn finger protein (UPF0148 family)|nr:hypothetical protein [Gemmatimonadota bacterium]MBT6147368.1 hypothetical protein [Gemmatimonadota bacterium]MBT7859357.1 hypothetical protein [Gemmatimonadota bacterium]
MADRLPSDARTISIHCAKCRTLLYKYHKGGDGSLVKIRPQRIAEDFTDGALECPTCGQTFARERMIGGGPAYKVIGGKLYTKGMRRK